MICLRPKNGPCGCRTHHAKAPGSPGTLTSCRLSGHSSHCTSCSSARPAQQTCWWTCPGWSGRLRTRSPSFSPHGTGASPPHKNAQWHFSVQRKQGRIHYLQGRANPRLSSKHRVQTHITRWWNAQPTGALSTAQIKRHRKRFPHVFAL